MLEGLFRNTLSPGQWVLLAAIPPAILALYFLKLRRAPVEVPSTYLWMRAIEDMHVNSLWQRLRRSLLLLLQLLLVGLAMLALLRPGWQGTRLDGQRFIFLIDNSASMSATDLADSSGLKQSRLDATKEKVAALVDQLERGMSAMIISFADEPRVVQEFTDNRRLLKQRLAAVEPTARPTDLGGALRLAGGLANPGQVVVEEEGPGAEVTEPTATTLYLFTDGRFADVADFSLGNLKPIFVPVGARDAGNLAITGFNTRRSQVRPEETEAFVQVANYTDRAASVVLELTLDGEFLDARSVDTPAQGVASVTFPLADAPAGELRVKIDRASLDKAGDTLRVDDDAFAALNDSEPGSILLVTPGNVVVETALGTARAGRLGGVEITQPSGLEEESRRQRMLAGAYDLVIFDRCAPASAEAMPRSGAFFIGQPPPTPAWIAADDDDDDESQPPPAVETVGAPQVIDWSRTHPLMAYVEVGDLLIGESVVLDPPAGAATLIDSTAGPLLAIAPRDSFEDLVLGFPILMDEEGRTVVNTKWYTRRSFPTFWLNVLDYFLGGSGDRSRGETTPGSTVEFRPRQRLREVVVTGPGGDEQTLKRNGNGPFVFQQTRSRGVYTVSDPRGDVIERFAVNLFDGAESDIRLQPTAEGEAAGEPLESIRIGYTDVKAESESPARKELWRPVLLVALGVLAFEWYVYNRRVYF